MACAWWGVSVGTLRLGSFLLLVVWYGVCVVGRQRRYLEAGVFSFCGGLVWRVCSRCQRRYLEAGVFSSSGGLVWRVRGRASALGTLRLGSFLLLVVLYGVFVVGHQRGYLEAGVFSYSGGLVWRVRSRSPAKVS